MTDQTPPPPPAPGILPAAVETPADIAPPPATFAPARPAKGRPKGGKNRPRTPKVPSKPSKTPAPPPGITPPPEAAQTPAKDEVVVTAPLASPLYDPTGEAEMITAFGAAALAALAPEDPLTPEETILTTSTTRIWLAERGRAIMSPAVGAVSAWLIVVGKRLAKKSVRNKIRRSIGLPEEAE